MSEPKVQTCHSCGEPTGRCEDDTLEVGESGPLCEACYPIAKINGLEAELTRLRAINAKLPKTKDGVTLTPDIHELFDTDGWARGFSMVAVMTDDALPWKPFECYFTRAAARDAAKAK